MRHAIAVALVTCATLAHAQTAPSAPTASPAKKELVAKVLQLQQGGIEGLARQIAQAPVLQLMQQANNVLQTQVAPEKREAIAKTIEADAKKFVEEAVPVIRERAMRLAPSTVGAVMEEKFSEDELKQLITWLESPVIKKYQQLTPEMQNSMVSKLMAEAAPILDPKLQALQQRMRTAFGMPAAASAPAGSAPAAGARPAAKAAPKAASK
ncbi:DUF2059 domain-containing protein [Piscinibacter sp. XHJ-5]|uniref:DUF2059 domain-containing protein n=1 Tax=Piscinibacter sp. XHJ-5 TaxID=3037797 RepID=UPI002452AC0E|nr:DUF2059 domain-containing protein [Piscinibacter sp. XHJ-5]